jgi:hypothetical protein
VLLPQPFFGKTPPLLFRGVSVSFFFFAGRGKIEDKNKIEEGFIGPTSHSPRGFPKKNARHAPQKKSARLLREKQERETSPRSPKKIKIK